MAQDKEIFEEYVSVMEKIMKLDVDPCEDFFEYATGNYSDEIECFPTYGFASAVERLLKNEKVNFPSFAKARDFYKSCKNERNFKELLQKSGLYETFGGWPAYENEWNDENFDWISASAKLATFGMQTIISHEIQYDECVKNVRAEVKEPEDDDKAEEILQLLGVTKDLIPDVLSDIHSMIEKIEAISPKQYSRRFFFETACSVKFGELIEDDHFDYSKYFRIYLGKPVDDFDVLWIENKEYFDNVFEVFNKNDLKQVANYIFWMAGKKFLKDDIPLRLTINFFSPSLVATILTVYYDEDDYAKNMYILNTFDKNYEKIKDRFNDCCPVQVGLYSTEIEEFIQIQTLYFQQDIVDEDYSSLEIDPENFLQNIKNLQAHHPTKSEYFCSSSKSGTQCDYYNLLQFLSVIIFNHNKPMLHHFIGNGLRIWININSFYRNDIVNKNSEKYPNEVLEQQMRENNIEDEDGTWTIKAYDVSLKQIFTDYKDWLSENPEVALYQEEILQPLGLDNEKAFFVAYAQRFSQKQFELRWPAVMCLWNLKDFSDAFKCEVGSKMNRNGKFLF